MSDEKIINYPLEIPFKDFMPGQVIQSGQFNDDMAEIEEKVNEVVEKHNILTSETDNHVSNKDNPHGVTAKQVGTYSEEEIDTYFDDIRNGGLYDKSIENRVLDDECVEARNIKNASITSIKVDSNFGSQINISKNIDITDRYTKKEVNDLLTQKVGEGTYSKEELDQMFEDVQAGQIVDGTIDVSKLKDNVGKNLDISANPSILDRYTKAEVNVLIQENGLPRDWGGLDEIAQKQHYGHLPVANVMTADEFIAPLTSVLDIDVKEVVEARNGHNSLDGRFKDIEDKIEGIEINPAPVEPTVEYVVNVKDFGAVGDGDTNDTQALKDAIKYACQNNLKLLFEKDKKYCITGSVDVYSNTNIDLNGSEVFLMDNSNRAMFRNLDAWGNATDDNANKNVKIYNGIVNGNSANNNSANLSGMFMNLYNGKNVEFKNLTIKNCYRNPFNLTYITNCTIENVEISNTGLEVGGYTIKGGNYGISFEGTNSNIVIKNLKVDNVVGGAIHLRKCSNAELINIDMKNLLRKSDNEYSIGITLTECNRVVAHNINGDNIDLTGIEINQNTNHVEFNNITFTNIKRGLILGSNGSDDTMNDNIIIRNLTCNIVGDTSDYAVTVNYSKNVVIDNFTVYGLFGNSNNISNILLKNGKINYEDNYGGTLLNNVEAIVKDVEINGIYFKHYQKHKHNNFVLKGEIKAGSSESIELTFLKDSHLFGKMLVKSYFKSSPNQHHIAEYLISRSNNEDDWGTVSEALYSIGSNYRIITPAIAFREFLQLTTTSDVDLQYVVEII